jgi:hypothetical protein
MNYQIVTEPLTRKELLEQTSEENTYVEGVVEMSFQDVAAHDYESFLDIISEKLVGSIALTDISFELVAGAENVAYIKVTGDVSSILEEE